MPFRPEHSLLKVEVPALQTIDTSSAENLFGMWSLFRSASNAMEDGRRLENLSWRLWNRETFCCAPESKTPRPSLATRPVSHSSKQRKQAGGAGDEAVPELSSSFDSACSSDIDEHTTSSSYRICQARPELELRRKLSCSRGHEKHLTPMDLEKMVMSIQDTKDVAPIELPQYAMAASQRNTEPSPFQADHSAPLQSGAEKEDATDDATPVQTSSAPQIESSASTIDTYDEGKSLQNSQTVGSEDSSCTEISSHSVVRGFVPGGAPSSYRSQTNLSAAQPTPILKTSPTYQALQPKKKGPMFTIGTSSGEDESSLDSHMAKSFKHGSFKSTLSDGLKRSASSKKTTSFQEEVAIAKAAEDSAVFESDEDDDEISESAIEDDDDSSDWEDSDEQSGPSSVNDKELFRRVDSQPNLASRRSLLTTLMHEPDRAKALANAATRSSPALRRSRTSSPNGPGSATTSPDPSHKPTAQLSSQLQAHVHGQPSAPKPIIMTTSNNVPGNKQLALSPRTTRRNMLSTELTESLRKNLLWERQHKSTGNLAALKRRHTAMDMKNLKQHPEPGPIISHNEGASKNFTNEYFHAGLGEYHSKGW